MTRAVTFMALLARSAVRGTQAEYESMQPGERRAAREPGLLSEAVELYLQQSGLARGMAGRTVLQAWSRAVGPALAGHARPVRFQRGQLWVEVDSAAHLHELKSFTGDRYRKEANSILGEERIRRVVFQSTGRP